MAATRASTIPDPSSTSSSPSLSAPSSWSLRREDEEAPLVAGVLRSAEHAGSTLEVPGLPGSFCLNYLPEIDLRSGTVVSCEALLRWRHPTFGLLRPGVSLEGSGWHHRLPAIEAWAMDEVCRQIAAWGTSTPGEVALNVSAARLTEPGFLRALDRALEASGIEPTALAVDVPVHVVASHPGLVRCLANDLVDRGVVVVIDGVSAFARHQVVGHIPASVWKVDLGVCGARRPGLHPSLGVAVERAGAAGVVTTAKAVEDLEVLHAVVELGFDRAFGHAISPAVPAAAMQAMIERGTVAAGPLFGAHRRLFVPGAARGRAR